MPINIERLVETLIALPRGGEWFEFKQNRFDADEFGQYVSALANSAILADQRCAYIIYGINDGTHESSAPPLISSANASAARPMSIGSHACSIHA